MSDLAIRTRGLARYFGQRQIVRDLDLSIPHGTVTGLLGLNGAGKTTTLRMLLGLLAPTRGTCELMGVPSLELSSEDRARIGHTVEGHFLYPWMRVRECERFHRGTHPRWDGELFEGTIRRFGIDPAARCGRLSRGQRAGVSLALMLGSSPEILILDDPALGLDPISRRALNETIIEFSGQAERTVLLSSHLLDDVERVADRILLMIDGQLVVDASLDELRSRVSGLAVQFESQRPALSDIPGLIHARLIGNQWMLALADADRATESAVNRLGVLSVEPIDMAFDEVVLAYLARSRRGESFLMQAEG